MIIIINRPERITIMVWPGRISRLIIIMIIIIIIIRMHIRNAHIIAATVPWRLESRAINTRYGQKRGVKTQRDDKYNYCNHYMHYKYESHYDYYNSYDHYNYYRGGVE